MIDLLFYVDEEPVFVELDTTDKTVIELKKEGRDILSDYGFDTIKFGGFYSVEEAAAMGLDTY